MMQRERIYRMMHDIWWMLVIATWYAGRVVVTGCRGLAHVREKMWGHCSECRFAGLCEQRVACGGYEKWYVVRDGFQRKKTRSVLFDLLTYRWRPECWLVRRRGLVSVGG